MVKIKIQRIIIRKQILIQFFSEDKRKKFFKIKNQLIKHV
jgi:hypothetical protein